MLVGGGILFALVMGLFALTMLRPGFGSGISTRGWILAGGLFMPVPILALLTFYALLQGERLLISGADASEALRVEARARQWAWEFRYPDRQDVPPTLNILHIPAGRPVDVVVISGDVIHSFWVPRLGGKVDAIPGHATRVRLLADSPGRFGGLCAEYCGRGHPIMGFWVEAHAPEDFTERMRRREPAE